MHGHMHRIMVNSEEQMKGRCNVIHSHACWELAPDMRPCRWAVVAALQAFVKHMQSISLTKLDVYTGWAGAFDWWRA